MLSAGDGKIWEGFLPAVMHIAWPDTAMPWDLSYFHTFHVNSFLSPFVPQASSFSTFKSHFFSF